MSLATNSAHHPQRHEKVAAFRKALDTADGLPAELRQDLCALPAGGVYAEGVRNARKPRAARLQGPATTMQRPWSSGAVM
ncbi:unnamed protein product [Durusdinium trenchii]|uniref:Histone deacetylase n=1 Tax=Durusdinium trenchii TaxID=1381693 RepID=A0ABP0HVP2_9DINO